MRALQGRAGVTAALAVVVVTAVSGCPQSATNPFDPATPPGLQAPGHIVGRVVLEGHDFAAAPVKLHVKDAAGRPAERNGAPIIVATRVDADGLPRGFTDDGLGAAGTFDVEVVPATYTLSFLAAENDAAQFFDADAGPVAVIPGAVVRADVRPAARPPGTFAGVVVGKVAGSQAGRAFDVRLEAIGSSGAVADQVLSLSSDGDFRFDDVAPGVSYRVKIESEVYAPASSKTFQVASTATADTPVDAGTLDVVLMRNLFSVDHGVSAPPFVNVTDVPVIMNGSVLVVDPTFETIEIRAGLAGSLVDATSGWGAVDAPAVVDLAAGADPATIDDGEVALDAQLRLCFQTPCDCPSDGSAGPACLSPLLSGFAPVDVTLDRAPPQVLSFAVAGIDAGTAGAPVVVRCADFGPDCAAAAVANAITLPVTAALFDVTGRVVSVGFAFSDTAPGLDVVDASAAVATVNGATPAIDPADADLSLRLFAKDAAGNTALIDTRAIHVDVTPLAFNGAGLVVTGTAARTVDGNAGTVIIPGDFVDVDVDVAGGTAGIARWELVREGGSLLSSQSARLPYAGAVSAFFNGVHREPVTLRAIVEDDVGNESTSPPFSALLWRAGDAAGTARFEGASQPAFTAALVAQNGGGAVVGGVTTASTGAIAFSEVPLGSYTLHLEAPGFVPQDVAGVVVTSNAVTDLGLHTLLLPRGDLSGRFVLEGQESSLNNSGVQVSIVDAQGAAVAAAITLADGSWRAAAIPAGTGYSAVAFFPGFVPAEVNGLAVVENVVTVVRPDGGGAPTPVLLRQLQGDFTLCSNSGFLEDACTPLLATNAATVRVGGISTEGFADFRISKAPFPPDESGFTPFVVAGGKTVAPTISFAAPADEHTVTVFLQFRAGPGNLGPVLQSQLVFDVTPPANAHIALTRGTGALKDGFTKDGTVTTVVTADAGTGDVSALGSGFVLFADAAPSLATAQASGTKCAHDVNCTVALDDLQERVHTAFAFACDAAGNCTSSPVSAQIVRDVTAPRASDGITLVPVGPLLSGGQFFTASAAFDVSLGVGHARTAAGGNVLDIAGNAVADVVAVRFASDARPASGNGSFDFGALPFVVVDRAADSAVAVAGPGLPAVDGAYRVFAQYEDAAGNVSEDANIPNFFDVTRDSVPPSANVIVNGGVLFTRTTTVPVAVTADPASPPVAVRFSTDGLLTFIEVPFPLPLNTTVNLGATRPDGPVTVTTRLVDAAGNTSDRTEALVLDRAAPTVLVTCTSCTSFGGALFSNASPATVTLQIDAVDGGSLDTVSVGGVTVPFTSVVSAALPVQNGVDNLTVIVADVAGNTTSVPVTIVHDRIAPTATLAIDAGAAFTSSGTVTLTTGAAGETPVSMRIANGPAASGPQQPFTSLVSWPLDVAGGDGAKQVTLEVSDAAGNANAVTRTITLDTAKPTGTVAVVGGTTLADGTKEVTTTAIQVQLTFPADAVNFVLQTAPALSPTCDNAVFPVIPAAPPSTPVNVTLAATTGSAAERRSVFVCVKDRANNTAFAEADMLLDQTRPTGSLVLQGGASFATSATGITAAVGDLAGDESQMKKGIDVVPDCSNAAGYEAFQSSFSINFAATAGPHTLSLCLKDVAGNFTAVPLADSIVVDLAAPTYTAPGFRINDGAAFTTAAAVALTIPATDAANESGVVGMRFATGSPVFSGAYESFVATRAFTLPAPTVEGSKTVCVEVIDGAGRIAQSCDDIGLDLNAPAGTVVINANATFATATNVSVVVTSGETGLKLFTSTVQPDCNAVADASYAAFTSPQTINPFALGAGEGARSVFACFKDGAGRTGIASDTIIVDTVVPPPPDLQDPSVGQRLTTSTPAFRWSASAGADSYRITVRTAATGVALAGFPVDVTTTQFQPVAALGNTDLTWEVAARDLAGNQSALAGPRAFTVDASAPTAPGALTVLPATSTNDNTPTLRFNLSTDTQTAAAALSYRVDIAEDAGFAILVKSATFTNLTSSPATFTPSTALADGAYFWRVSVSDQAGNSTTVNGPSFTIDTTPPGAPTINAPVSPSNATSPVLTWSAVAGAADFHVTVTQLTPGTCNAGFTTIDTTTTSTSFTPTLVGGSRCHYRLDVHARDALLNEGGGASAEFIVDTVAPVVNGTLRINDATAFTNNTILSVLTGSDDAVSLKLAFKQSGVGTSGAPPAPVGPGACTNGTFNEADFTSAILQPSQPVLTFPVPPNTVVANSVTAGPPNACKMLGVKYFDDAGNSTAANVANTTAVVRVDTIAPDVPRIATTSHTEDANAIVLALGVDSLDHNFTSYQIRNGSASFANVAPIDPTCIASAVTTCTFNVSLNQDIENRIGVRAIDAAGNASAEDFVTIREDSTAPAAPATLTLTPGDELIAAAWSPTTDADLGGFRVYYTLKNGTCPSTTAAYTGAFAVQGSSPIDVGFNTDFTLTGVPNGVGICVAVTAVDVTEVPGPKESAPTIASTVPYELAPVLRTQLTAGRLGIGASDVVGAVALRRGLLYAAVGGATGGLVELDVAHEGCFDVASDTAFATCTGRVKSTATLTDPRDIVVQGGFAFVADGAAGLRVFKLVEGQAPVLRHTIGGIGNAVALASSGSTLVVAADTVGFRIFDVSSLYSASPTAPSVVATIAAAQASDVDVQGDRLMVAPAVGGNTQFFDISNPAAPVASPGSEQCPFSFSQQAAKMSGREAFATGGGSFPKLGACNMSNAPLPAQEGIAATDNQGRLELAGAYAFVLGSGVVDVIDISNRAAPRFLGNFADGSGGQFSGSIAVEGNRGFFAPGLTSFVDVLTLSPLNGLELIGSSFDASGGRNAAVMGAELVDVGTGGENTLHARRDSLSPDSVQGSGQGITFSADAGRIAECVFTGATTSEYHVVARNQAAGFSLSVDLQPPNGERGVECNLDWPWLLMVSAKTAGSSDNVRLRSVDGRGGATTSATQFATIANNGGVDHLEQLGQSTIAIYGGFAFVTVKTQNGSTQGAVEGLYRVAYNAETGAIGASTLLVPKLAGAGVVAYGRRLYFWTGGADGNSIYAASLDNPGALTSTDFVTLSTSGISSAQNRTTFLGNTMLIPRASLGTDVERIVIPTTGTRTPTALSGVTRFAFGSFASAVNIAGDRAYVTNLNGGTDILRLR